MKFIVFSLRRAGAPDVEYNLDDCSSQLTHTWPGSASPPRPSSRDARPLSGSCSGSCWLVVAIAGGRCGVCVLHRARCPSPTRRTAAGQRALGPVTVTRDGHGVPTIEAASLDDLVLRARLCHGAGPAVANGRDAALRRRRTLGDSRERALLSSTANSGFWACEQRRGKRWRPPARAIAVSSKPMPAESTPTSERMATACPLNSAFCDYAPKPWQPDDSVVIANAW